MSGPICSSSLGCALMLEDEQGVCGYALAAADSRAFYGRYENEWRPELCSQFAEPTGDPTSWSRVQQIHYLYHHPDYYLPEPYEQFPAHLHIDLMTRAHRQGHGTKMMNLLIDRLPAKGVPGVHLGMAASNDRVHSILHKPGFCRPLRNGVGDDETLYMGKRLTA